MTKWRSFSGGFSLVEIMISIGLLSVISLGLMNMMTTASRQQRSLQAKDAMRELTGEIRNVVSNREACINTFGGNKITQNGQFPDFTVNQIKDQTVPTPVIKYATTIAYLGNILELSEIKVRSYIPDALPQTGIAKLQIQAKKLGDGQSGVITQQLLTLKIKVDAQDRIIECMAIGSQSDSLWSLATNLVDIFYSGGKVGIGTGAPGTMLEVAGGIKAGSSGIAEGTSCAPNAEGTMAYDIAAHAPVFCNDTGIWSFMGRTLTNCQLVQNSGSVCNVTMAESVQCPPSRPHANGVVVRYESGNCGRLANYIAVWCCQLR